MADLQVKREQWKKEQARLRGMLSKVDDPGFPASLRYVGGVDISFVKNSDRALACFSVLEWPSLKLIDTYYFPCLMTEPYMPGFLAFRFLEVHHLVEVVNMFLKKFPDARGKMLIMVDGNGILHYRGFGSASHLGVVLDIPTIGVGKELLVVDGMDAEDIADRCLRELRKFGDQVELVGPRTGRIYGAAVRTKSAAEPIYVSIGHRISLETAVDLVLKCSKSGSLLPEPVRLADGLSRDVIIKNPGLTKYFTRDDKPIAPSSSATPRPQPQQPPSGSHRPTQPPFTSTTIKDKPAAFSYAAAAASSIHPPTSTPSTTPTTTTSSLSTNEAIPEKKSGKRGAFWDCTCGASNPVTKDACEFCYHSRAGESSSSTSWSKVVENAAQKRKSSWKCRCGEEVVGKDVCPECRYINM